MVDKSNLIDKIEIIEIENGWVVNHSNETIAFLSKKDLMEYLDKEITESE